MPALESLLSAALERESLLADVVETAALRRTDVVKTALLRAVSHDLRSPLTAISAAAEAVGSPSLSEEERLEMAAIIQQETQRLSRLVDNLLDLSRLEAGAAEPHAALTSVDEVIRAALAELSPAPEDFSLSIDRDLPLVSVDPVQLERAFVNVLENARRHSGGHPVSVRARAVRSLGAAGAPRRSLLRTRSTRARRSTRVSLRLKARAAARPATGWWYVSSIAVRHTPGAAGARVRTLLPSRHAAGRTSRLRLGFAIARGFTESNGGRLHVESLPGQGATFVFELPLARAQPSPSSRSAVEVAASSEHAR